MTQTTRVLIALVAGLLIGVVTSVTDIAALYMFISFGEPIGVLWVNGLRMIVLPLIVSLLITGIASAPPSSAGRVGGATLLWIVLLIAGSALFTGIVAPLLLSFGEFDFDVYTTTQQSAATTQTALPPFRDWIVNLIPSNPK